MSLQVVTLVGNFEEKNVPPFQSLFYKPRPIISPLCLRAFDLCWAVASISYFRNSGTGRVAALHSVEDFSVFSQIRSDRFAVERVSQVTETMCQVRSSRSRPHVLKC